MALPIFILTVDFFGIAVALPSIGHDLQTSTTGLEWTVNAFMLAFAAVPESDDETAGSVAFAGLVSVTLGFVLLVMGVELVDSLGAASPIVVVCLVAGVIVLLAFYFIEGRVKDPLVEFHLFKGR